MKVIKRNGRTEELDISKIKKYTTAAVAGIENVSLSELEVDAKIQFRDMITTEEIQQTLIKTAVDKIDIDRPNWTFVAARLFLYDLYHKVTSFNGYNHLREYFELTWFRTAHDRRQRGSETEIHSSYRKRRKDYGICHHRAGRRYGRRRHYHYSSQGWRLLCTQRT